MPLVGELDAVGVVGCRVSGVGCRHAGSGAGRAVVQRHDDVSPELILHLHRPLGGERDGGAVDVALEGDAVIVELADVGEAEDLISAGVGEHRAVPAHPVLQATHLRHQLPTRAQQQVIGIGEDDLGPKLAQLLRPKALHRGLRAHGHEGGRVKRAMRRGHPPDSGGGGGVFVIDLESQGRHRRSFGFQVPSFKLKVAQSTVRRSQSLKRQNRKLET